MQNNEDCYSFMVMSVVIIEHLNHVALLSGLVVSFYLSFVDSYGDDNVYGLVDFLMPQNHF